MSFTPAHIAAVRGCFRTDSISVDELIRVRQLLQDRHYKQCITSCDDLLSPNLHSAYKVYLHFHKALSYESLGLVSHMYSSKTLVFLVSAKDMFEGILAILSQPFAMNEQGQCLTPRTSPATPTFILSKSQKIASRLPRTDSSFLTKAATQTIFEHELDASSDSSTYSHEDVTSDDGLIPGFDVYTSQEESPVVRSREGTDVRSPHCTTDIQLTSNNHPHRTALLLSAHKARLNVSLSHEHVLAEELVPSPLFRRNKKIAVLPGFVYPFREGHLSSLSQGECLSPKPSITFSLNERTLPPLPFFKNIPNIKLKSGRLVLIPTRKTAIQTMIDKFEDSVPLFSPSSRAYLSSPADSSPIMGPRTPITPRFNMIRDTLAPLPSNNHLQQYLTSVSLARYNSVLSDIRTQTLFHLSVLIGTIEKVEKAQTEKSNVEETPSAYVVGSSNVSSNGSPTKLIRAISYRNTESGHQDLPLCNQMHREGVASREGMLGKITEEYGRRSPERTMSLEFRIQKLRREGFQVRKERYGFKGTEYYENLRRRAERELERCKR